MTMPKDDWRGHQHEDDSNCINDAVLEYKLLIEAPNAALRCMTMWKVFSQMRNPLCQ